MELCTTMNPSIKSSTGHVIWMVMSEANKAEARAVAGYAHRQNDVVTWEHCADEGQTCQCDGTVRYGALGNHEMCNGDALEYCNSYPDLVNAFCGGSTCTDSARIDCTNHFNNFGRNEIADGRRYAPNCGIEWDDLGAGGCLAANDQFYNRYVLVTGQYGFSGTIASCKQLCARYDECIGINFVHGHNHCHLNVDSGATLSGVGWNIHGGAGTGPIARAAGSGNWECSRATRKGKWSSPIPVRGQISCSNGAFGADPYPNVAKKCECTSLEWEALGAGGCLDKNGQYYRRHVLVTGQYGFSGTVGSCKQLCAKHTGCVGINFVNYHNHCHLNLAENSVFGFLPGVGSNIHHGPGNGPIARAAGSGNWECHRVVNYF